MTEVRRTQPDPTAAAVRAAQAEAWDEGFQDGRRQDAEGDDGPRFINPYRADRLACCDGTSQKSASETSDAHTDTAAPERVNPYLPEPPTDGKHIFNGGYRCVRCGVYNHPAESNREALAGTCQGRWAHSGKMRYAAEDRWAAEKAETPAAPEGVCDAIEDQSQARCHKPSDHHGPHNGWAHYPGQLVTWPAAPVAIEGVETVEWGVRFAPGEYGVRWDPGYGSGVNVPYTEAEARADSARTGYPLVRRTRVEFEDRVSEWSPVELETSEPEGGESR